MSQLLPEFEQHKGHIPEFIVKLYHILQVTYLSIQKKQYQDYLCWNGDDEILIKSGKKLQDKVLPHFFRHKHLSSFIRQLNMYKFSKVAKLAKEKNHMYFKNDYFQRGNMQITSNFSKNLLKIKRNNKKGKTTQEIQTPSKSYEDDEVSLMHQLSQQNTLLSDYKGEIKKSFMEIKEILSKVIQKYPDAAAQLTSAKLICDQIMEGQEKQVVKPQQEIQENQNQLDDFDQQFLKNDMKNMLTTEKNMSRFDAPMFLSNISGFNFL